MKTNKGISLIVLVITIIVMIILAGSIILTLSNNGIINKAHQAVGDTNKKVEVEQRFAEGKLLIAGKWYNSVEEYLNSKNNNNIEDDNGNDGENDGTGDGDENVEVILQIASPIEDILLKKKEASWAEGEEALTATIIASISGVSEQPQITWEASSDDITLSSTTGNTITVTAAGTKNSEITVMAKCTYDGKEYAATKKVTLEILPASYVGHYADVDGNGSVDGVIYADLAIGKKGSWASSYSYGVESGLKEYKVIKTANGDFGNGKDVLQATSEGKDRFYVMSLSDFSSKGSQYSWYDSFTTGYSEYVFEALPWPSLKTTFGNGYNNTREMISFWKASSGGAQNTNDIWGKIQSKFNSGWFIPSNGEWDAFCHAFKISASTYEKYGLSNIYWTSNVETWLQMSSNWVAAYVVEFEMYEDILSNGMPPNEFSFDSACVRLSIKF